MAETALAMTRGYRSFWRLETGYWKLFIHTFYPRSESTEQFVRNGPNRRSNFAHAERFSPLFPDDDDFVTGSNVGAGDVDHRHVHADRAHDRGTAATDEHEAAPCEAAIEAVRVTRRNDGDRRRPIHDGLQAVSRAFARAQSFDMHDTAME